MSARTAVASVALILAAAASAAWADAVATATLSDFRIQLTDLAPGDGIAPSVTFTGASGTEVFGSPSGPPNGDWIYGPSAFAPVSGTSAGAAWDASITFSGDPFSATGATGSAQSSTALVGYNTASGASLTLNYEDQTAKFTFTLSPETTMVFSAVGHVSDTVSSVDIETASSVIGMVLDKLDSRGVEIPGWYSDSWVVGDAGAAAVRYDPVCGCFPPPVTSVEHDAPMTLSFTNSTDAPLTAEFEVADSAFANSNPVTIPEPDGFSLAFAGLGVMAVLARCRLR